LGVERPPESTLRYARRGMKYSLRPFQRDVLGVVGNDFMKKLDASEILNVGRGGLQRKSPRLKRETLRVGSWQAVGHPAILLAERSMFDSLQVFLGAGVGVRERQGRVEFLGSGLTVALFLQQLS
jgi:hypothetical protein